MHKDGLLGRGEKIKYLLNIGKVNIDFPTFVTRLSGDSNRDTDTMSRENAKITVSAPHLLQMRLKEESRCDIDTSYIQQE